MCQHAQLCKPMAANNDDDDREDSPPDYKDDDNGNEDDEFMFEEDPTCQSTPHPMQSKQTHHPTLMFMPE